MAHACPKNQTVIKHGPYGSRQSENFWLRLEQGESIKEVIIRHGHIVDAIGFVVANENDDRITKKYGGNGGKEDTIKLQDGEYVTQITGKYGDSKFHSGLTVIASIKIHTNMCPEGYGKYGNGQDIDNEKFFQSPPKLEGEINGYFGRCHKYLDSIGFYEKKEP